MKKLIVFNKWFLIFIAIVLVTLSSVIVYIQTKHFSLFVTSNLKKTLNHSSIQVAEFERIQLGIFPPSFKLVNVSVSFLDKSQDINAVFDEVSLDFSLSGFLNSKMAITKLMIERGSISVRGESHSQKTKTNLKEIVQTIKQKVPIRFSSVGIYKTDININETIIGYIDQVELYRGLEDIELTLKASEFIHTDMTQVKLNQIYSKLIVTENEININKFDAVIDKQKVILGGIVKNPFNKSARMIDLKMSGELDLKLLNKFEQVERIGHFNQGIVKYSGGVSNISGQKIHSVINLSGSNINCDYVEATSLKAKIELKNDSLIIREAKIEQENGTVLLERGFELYSITKNRFVDDTIDVLTQDFPLDSALRYLHPTLKPLQGKLNGPVSFSLFGARHFEFKAGSGARAQDLELVYDDLNILKFDWLEVAGMLFVYKDDTFYLEGEAIGPNSLVQVNGEVGKGKLLFQMPQARLELEDLGGIAGFELKGDGIFDIEIGTDINKQVTLRVAGVAENTVFEGNELSRVDVDIIYNFNTSKLTFNNVDGEIDEYDYNFQGDILLEEEAFDLTFITEDMGFTSLRRLAKELVFSDLPISLDFISGRLGGEVKIGGTLGNILIDGDINDADVWVAGEYFSNVKTKFNKRENTMKVFETHADLAGGSVIVGGNYLLERSVFDDFFVKIQKVEASRLNFLDDPRLKFSSQLNGELLLISNEQEQEGKIDIFFEDTRALNKKFSNSFMKAILRDDKLIIESEFLSSFYVDSIINFSKETSLVSVKSKTKKLGDLFTFIGVDPELVGLKGEIDFELLTKFKIDRMDELDLEASLFNFDLNKDGFNLRSSNTSPVFKVRNGDIQKGEVLIKGNNSLVEIKANGNFMKKYKISNKGKLNTKFFEFFRDYWITSSGELNWNIELKGNKSIIDHQMSIKSSDWKVGFIDLPISPERIEIDIEEKNQKINVRKLNLITPNGSIDTSGIITFSDYFPDLKLKTKIDNIRANLARDSFLDSSGNLSLTGNRFPFLLQGDIDILKGSLGEGLVDELSSQDDSLSIPKQYLPSKKVSGDFDLIEMGIKIQSQEPIYFRNTWINIPFNVLLRLEGSETSPLVDGRIYSQPRAGKFVLKDQNYIIKKADINFSGTNDYQNPLIDLEAESNISNYLINSRIVGNLNNYSVILNSSPPLESSDILSLVTFGYTQNASQDVGQDSRDNLTSVGVGSLLLDQLKIKSLLKDSFGLTLAVTSEEQEVSTGFLNSRNGGDSIVDGRTQTSTRVQISKKLSREFDMVMSRDLSNDYQGLNINYKVRPGVTARGIIEQQNNLEIVEGTNNDTAVGVDVGFRWSFE